MQKALRIFSLQVHASKAQNYFSFDSFMVVSVQVMICWCVKPCNLMWIPKIWTRKLAENVTVLILVLKTSSFKLVQDKEILFDIFCSFPHYLQAYAIVTSNSLHIILSVLFTVIHSLGPTEQR
jgi:hypothetical protein